MRVVKERDVRGKRVLIRCDFNVPLKNGRVADDARIRAALPTLRFLVKHAGKVVILTHVGRPKGVDPSLSTRPLVKPLEKLLRRKVAKLDDCINVAGEIDECRERVVLLENVRFYSEEKKNDARFARKLAGNGDVFVNDAFSACHREHASVVAVTRYVPSVAGFLVEKEVNALSRLERPKRPFVAVLGGVKVSTKIKAVESLVRRCDAVLIGGAMALTFAKALGYEVGKSRVEPGQVKAAKALVKKGRMKLMLPVDVACGTKEGSARKEYAINRIPKRLAALDIGSETLAAYEGVISSAKTVFWNGPVGLFEKRPFAKGTKGIARAIARNKGMTVVGGGDTVAAIDKFKVAGFSHVSTGGGASLRFIQGKKLPGLKPLS